MNVTHQSSDLLKAVRSRSEDAASRVNVLAQAVLSELDKLAVGAISADYMHAINHFVATCFIPYLEYLLHAQGYNK